MSIRARLLLLVLLAVGPAFGVLIHSGLEQRRLAAAVAQEEALRLVRLAAREHEAALAGVRHLLQVLAALPAVRDHDGRACSAFLAGLVKESPRYANLGANRPDGQIFCSALPLAGPVSSADRLWFRRAVESREFAIGGYQVGQLTGRATIDFGYPVLDPAGTLRAVVFAALDLRWLGYLLAEASLPPGASLMALDQRGVLLARYPPGEDGVGEPLAASAPLEQAIRMGRTEGTLEAPGPAGEPHLYGFSRISPTQGGGDGIYLALATPRGVAFQEVDAILRRSFAWLAAVGALVVGAAWAGGDLFVLRRMRALAGAARRLQAGDLGARTGLPHGREELGELARAFDEMAAALEARQAEAERAEQELRLRSAALEAAANGIVITGPEGRIVWANPAFSRLTGYTPEEAIGQSPRILKSGKHDRAFYDHLWKTVLSGQVWSGEVVNRRKDGSLYTEEMTITPVRDAQGKTTHYVAIKQDITERRNKEGLEEQYRRVQEASRLKSVFLGRMSHELRTPLNAILGFAQLLQMEATTPEQRESADQILKGGRHLLDLITEVLDIARIETGRLHLSPEPVAVRDLIRDAVDLMQPLAAQRGIRISLGAMPAEDGRILADCQRLKQVLLNLLANAVKYNQEQGSVTVACTAAAENRFRIQVQDTGPGIPPDRMGRLFIPFDRLGAEQTGVEGTGLGLPLSKRLVEAMLGTLGVDSVPGHGSTFWVELPMAEGPAQQLQRLGIGAPGEGHGTAGTVLYIEDNLSNVQLVERVLAHRPGVSLLPAMQGRLGMDLARQHRPGLILLDLQLPDVPGETVLAQLQADPRTHHIPVAVISADATPGQIKRLRAAGARAYLTKPLDVQALLALVDATLNGQAAGAA